MFGVLVQGDALPCRDWGLSFRVSDFGFRVWGVGVRLQG